MSIQVPSPSYGSLVGRESGPSEAGPADPARLPEDPTTSGDTHAESPTRQSSAHTRATIDLMHHPPAEPVPEHRERPKRPKVRVRRHGPRRSGSVRIAGGAAPARMGAPRRTLGANADGRRRHRGGPAARTLLGRAARG